MEECKSLQVFHLKTDAPSQAYFREIAQGGGIVLTWSLQLKWLRLRENIEMLCAKSIADLCRSRAALDDA